ncbi:hypothetical protein CMQ_6360 [Grosmannia clavigera kw1407]|uniref:Wings apart-like protein C-terminal domain-containing protein n=1 Tax=Grosmannia clavigera (strain kw1407 / UAMH 11150) TaxID=655863 RepID=F0XM23_GROCL|nr:uncharacterized protein CMQ_6360 [Grosmannia clavigera kw1407]EFX01418.1 hypothetical protein CMQ_6360 [Grosmannia clavigera kw1407]
MLSTWSDKSQPSKKKLVSYGKAMSRSRNQPASLSASAQTIPESSQASAKAPVKDIYDFDYVGDDPPPVAKTPARKKPTQAERASTKPSAISKATVLAVPATHLLKRAADPKHPAVARPVATPAPLPAPTTARGTKRKSIQSESAACQQSSTGISTAKPLQSTPSPDPITLDSPHSTTTRVSRTTKNPLVLGSSSPSASLTHQRSLRTPPRDAAISSASRTLAQSTPPSKARVAAEIVRQQRLVQPSSGVPFRSQGIQSSQPQQAQQAQTRPAALAQRKRRRLIDTLAAQREESESDGEDTDSRDLDMGDDEEASSQTCTIASKYRHRRSTPVSDNRTAFMDVDSLVTASPGRMPIAPSTPGTLARRPTARRPNIKFTYNVERTMLAEQPPALDGPSGSDLSVLQSLLPEADPKPSAFDFDDDASGPSQGAIQSIHELRQAGANSRFSDELVDIMDRIGTSGTGKASSTRRSALLEMAGKLQGKSFMRHFRDHGSETQLFRDVGKETDVVAGYVLGCIVITLLANGTVSGRFLRDLRTQKIDRLFGVLLRFDEDIVRLAKDRKNNVSAFSRQILGTLKEAMQKLPIWKPAPAAPSDMSPRTVALVGLHLFVQQIYGGGGFGDNDTILSSSLTKQLFAIVSSTLPSAYDNVDGEDEVEQGPSVMSLGFSGNAETVDMYLALSLLERHSVAAMQSDIGAEWTRHYIPIVADALEVTLEEKQRLDRQLNGLELLALKLAMNTANNNPEAARHYVDKGHLRRLAEQGSRALAGIVRCVKTGSDVTPGALDELLLMLGVMINFSENDETAAESLVEGGGSVLIERLGASFLDGRSIAAEADSEEKTQINVAFAYLSILLGYLCRYNPVYKAFKRLSPNGSLKPLLDSIHQFIDFHDKVGKTSDVDGAEASHFTARLQALARELELRAY